MMDERTKAMLERLVREQPKEAAERLIAACGVVFGAA